jgi:hypothetical protein
MAKNPTFFRLKLFIYLVSVELLLPGVVTAFLASRQGLEFTLAISALTTLAGLFGLCIPALLQQKSGLEKKATEILSGMPGRIFSFTLILLMTAFFFVLQPPTRVVLVASPLLICIWLIGVEILLLFDSSQESKHNRNARPFGHKEKMLAIISVFLAYGYLMLPSHIPSWFDGFPWDSPIEFVFAAFLIPLTIAIGWKVFAKRFFVIILVPLFVVKLTILGFLPQSGLGIHAYRSEEAASAHQWDRSYYTFATPGYTQVISRPYYKFREFPVEWTNNHFGFDKNQFWLKLELNGYIHLHEDERLVFAVQGAKQKQGELLDILTQRATSLVFIERIEDADSALYSSIPEAHEVEIQSTILFDNIGRMRMEPILLYPDGSTRSLFESPRVWTSLKGADLSKSQVNAFGFIQNALGLLFVGLMLFGLFTATYTACQGGEISLIDLYLALSSLPLFFVGSLIHKKYLNVLTLSVILAFFIVKLVENFLYRRQFSWKVFLFSIGIALLCLSLALDMYDLRVITNFPPNQDGLEYQTFAHNIYVNLDVFLAGTPPRAYKILFPYIVGFLHILFGHSAAAQLFINTWCAILSCVIIIELAKKCSLTDRVSFGIAVYYLLLLFLPSLYIFYFRFGLIEPFSTTLLLLTYYFAIERRLLGLFIFGSFTVLLRLDYLGMAFASILLTGVSITGSLKNAWAQLFDWLKTNWRLLTTYMASICLPALFVVSGYFLLAPNYMLNASDTAQTSLKSVIEGLIRVIAGGTINDVRERYAEFQAVDVLLISAPLVIGFLVVVASAFPRTSIFKKIDLRLSLLALSLLPAYMVVRPAAYFPRFSLPLLPIDLIMISLFFRFWSQR